MIHHHPDDEFLLPLAAGRLSAAPAARLPKDVSNLLAVLTAQGTSDGNLTEAQKQGLTTLKAFSNQKKVQVARELLKAFFQEGKYEELNDARQQSVAEVWGKILADPDLGVARAQPDVVR